MSDEEEEASGFGNASEEEEEEDAGGFGEASEEEEEEEEGGFGDADEGGGDEPEPEPAPPKSKPKAPSAETGAWMAFAKKTFKDGCNPHYEHPGLAKLWTQGVTKSIKSPAKNAEAHIFYRQLLVFMGDLAEGSGGTGGGVSVGAFGGAVVSSSRETIEELCWNGIKDKSYRVELYCQVLKQLYKTSSKKSHARGFILLNMYLGSFPPPQEMIPSIIEIISLGPSAFIGYSQARLAMSRAAPKARGQPPITDELTGVKNRRAMSFPIALPGGKTFDMEMDSMTTASDLLASVGHKLGLQRTEGFGIRIRDRSVTFSIGKANKFVLDVIARLDREAEHAGNEGERAWTMEYAKEETAPWYDALDDDHDALDLVIDQIYERIIGSQWTFDNEEEYVKAFATKGYIDYGNNLPSDGLEAYLTGCIPAQLLLDGAKKPKKVAYAKKLDAWCEIVEKAHARLEVTKTHVPKDVVQAQMIDFICEKWPHFFSSWYDAEFIMGPGVRGLENAFIAVNETGLYIGVQGGSTVMKHWPYAELEGIKKAKDGTIEITTVAVPTKKIGAASYSFKMLRGADTPNLVKLATRLKTSAQ